MSGEPGHMHGAGGDGASSGSPPPAAPPATPPATPLVRPFSRLLVANRGEVALRIMRTARRMGLEVVAVHSEADRDAPHLRAADMAVPIGPADPARSYLSVPRIIEAARASGAEAVHPGYGFLAENPDLARACRKAGLVFVGPDADMLARMGDKARARALMAQAGLPVLPGWSGADQSDAALEKAARALGFPLMIKALAGGGGRGMQFVDGPGAFPAALARARAEALAAFGDSRVMLERALARPRHVEVQLAADAAGRVVHLGMRDCSLQRRHQKLVEEAPPPGLPADLMDEICARSVAALERTGYLGIGTAEFLLDGDGGYHFLELNARLQVEHPVTEALTGVDLVEWQLLIAMGRPLPLAQPAIRLRGHAIEVRLCAEDPAAGFRPQAGTVGLWRTDPALRVEHALEAGGRVPAEYDSMIAKLVAHGDSREQARLRLIRGLRATALLGIRTNRDHLLACLAHPDFAAGRVTTGFLEDHAAALAVPSAGAVARAAMLAAAFRQAAPGQALVHGFPAPLRLRRDGVEHAPLVRAGPGGLCRVAMEGQDDLCIRVLAREADGIRWQEVPANGGGKGAGEGPGDDAANDAGDDAEKAAGPVRFTPVLQAEGRLWLALDEGLFDFADLSLAPAGGAQAEGGDGVLRAQLSGRVQAVAADPGQRVEAGAPLVTIEAMKMEHPHAAPVAGRIEAVLVAPGDQVQAGQPLVRIAAGAGGGAGAQDKGRDKGHDAGQGPGGA